MNKNFKDRQSFARMVGSVAGAMDQGEANTLRQGENGKMLSQPSQKYLNQAKALLTEPMRIPSQNFSPLIPEQNPMPIQKPILRKESNLSLDVSQYIGQSKPKQETNINSDQLALLKKALEPINTQLEKICVLIGLVYQKLNESEKKTYSEPKEEVLSIHDEDEEGVDEQIKELEKTLKNRPKPLRPLEPKDEDEIEDLNVEIQL